jgi:hypothetical protein
VLPGTDLLLGGDAVPPRPDPRSRAGRVLACLQDLQAGREAAEAQAREQGLACLQAVAAGTANGRPPAAVAVAAQQLRLERLITEQQAAVAGWEAARAAGTAGSRPGRRPADPQDTARVRRARARLADLQAAAGREAGRGEDAAAQCHRPGLPAPARPRRRVHPGLQLPGRRGR